MFSSFSFMIRTTEEKGNILNCMTAVIKVERKN